jgi:hypothetical protein
MMMRPICFINERDTLVAFLDAHLAILGPETGSFPASQIHKGLIMRLEYRDLSEEGVGFGVPVLKLLTLPEVVLHCDSDHPVPVENRQDTAITVRTPP